MCEWLLNAQPHSLNQWLMVMLFLPEHLFKGMSPIHLLGYKFEVLKSDHWHNKFRWWVVLLNYNTFRPVFCQLSTNYYVVGWVMSIESCRLKHVVLRILVGCSKNMSVESFTNMSVGRCKGGWYIHFGRLLHSQKY